MITLGAAANVNLETACSTRKHFSTMGLILLRVWSPLQTYLSFEALRQVNLWWILSRSFFQVVTEFGSFACISLLFSLLVFDVFLVRSIYIINNIHHPYVRIQAVQIENIFLYDIRKTSLRNNNPIYPGRWKRRERTIHCPPSWPNLNLIDFSLKRLMEKMAFITNV